MSTAASLLPASHRDLLERPLLGALTTRMPDGMPQLQPVWYDLDGYHIRISTMLGFRKERNMRADPRVALLIVDPDDTGRWIEIRGRVELEAAGAREHLDGLARRYTGATRYFGECVPAGCAETEAPVIARLTPLRVVCDAIHRPGRAEREAEGAVAPTGSDPSIDADPRGLDGRSIRQREERRTTEMTGNKRVLRIRVSDGEKPKVNITVPLGLARLARIGGIADKISKQHGIDLDEILEGIEGSPDGTICDVVDEKSGDHVEVSLETPGADATPAGVR